jgi:hypothetical protein
MATICIQGRHGTDSGHFELPSFLPQRYAFLVQHFIQFQVVVPGHG